MSAEVWDGHVADAIKALIEETTGGTVREHYNAPNDDYNVTLHGAQLWVRPNFAGLPAPSRLCAMIALAGVVEARLTPGRENHGAFFDSYVRALRHAR